FTRNERRAGAAEGRNSTEGCSACCATGAHYCCGAICVTDAKVSGCVGCGGCIVASAVGGSSAKGAGVHRRKKYQSRDFPGGRLRHAARPLPKDRGRFDRLPLVRVRGSETRFN